MHKTQTTLYRRPQRTRCLPWIALAGMLLAGCASNPSQDDPLLDGDQISYEKLNLDPMLIRANKDGETEAIDVEEVFQKAYEAYSERRYEKSARHYEFILEYFEDSRFYRPSLYNLGLAYEKLERWRDAAGIYVRIIEDDPTNEDAKDAYFRLAQAYANTGEDQRLVELMTDVLLQDTLTDFDRVEAHIRRANALFNLDRWTEAETGFQNALDINSKAPRDQRLTRGSNLLLQAHFGLGRAFHEQAKAIQLRLPVERMTAELQEKAEFTLSAQRHYLDAVRQQHPRWSTAAGYMVGKLYQDFYSSVFAAEMPTNLTPEETVLYFEELHRRIRPVMERAVFVYEKNLSLSRRLGTRDDKNEWVARTEQSLRTLEQFMNDPLTQRTAALMVVKGADIDKVWDPQGTAQEFVAAAVREASQVARAPKDDDRLVAPGRSSLMTKNPTRASLETQ